MFETLELTRMAQSLARHAGARLGVIAQNVANADTPGYRTQDIEDFASSFHDQRGLRITRPGHLSVARDTDSMTSRSGGAEAPNGNDVSLELEMVKAATARQEHDMALLVYRTTSGVIRASLGRSG